MAKQVIEIVTRPGTIPVLCYIEDLPFGKILRQLHDTQGIVTVDVLLGQGGKQSPLTPDDIQASQANGNLKNQLVNMLAQGAKKPARLAAELGRKTTTIYTALASLKRHGIVVTTSDGWRLSAKAAAAANIHNGIAVVPGNHDAPAAVIALPAPTLKKGPKGKRVAPGAGAHVILAALHNAEPKTPAELAAACTAAGMSAKSITGVLARARVAGVIRHDAKNHRYELTAKGRHQAEATTSAEVAHG